MEANARMRVRNLDRLDTTYLLDKIDLMQKDIDLQYRQTLRTRDANNIILTGISTVSAVLGGFVVASLVEAPLDLSNESYVPVVRRCSVSRKHCFWLSLAKYVLLWTPDAESTSCATIGSRIRIWRIWSVGCSMFDMVRWLSRARGEVVSLSKF